MVQTVVAKTPLIFLREAETAEGQIDVLISPNTAGDAAFLNYTIIDQRIRDADFSSLRHSPRIRLGAEAYNLQWCNAEFGAEWPYKSATGASCTTSCVRERCAVDDPVVVEIAIIDSDREAAMNLGRKWEIKDPIPAGHVVLQQDLAAVLNATVGSSVVLNAPGIPLTVRHAFAQRPEPNVREIPLNLVILWLNASL